MMNARTLAVPVGKFVPGASASGWLEGSCIFLSETQDIRTKHLKI